jgi:hypothetical protein
MWQELQYARVTRRSRKRPGVGQPTTPLVRRRVDGVPLPRSTTLHQNPINRLACPIPHTPNAGNACSSREYGAGQAGLMESCLHVHVNRRPDARTFQAGHAGSIPIVRSAQESERLPIRQSEVEPASPLGATANSQHHHHGGSGGGSPKVLDGQNKPDARPAGSDNNCATAGANAQRSTGAALVCAIDG